MNRFDICTITMEQGPRVFTPREVVEMSRQERLQWDIHFQVPKLGQKGFGSFVAKPKAQYGRHYSRIGAIA